MRRVGRSTHDTTINQHIKAGSECSYRVHGDEDRVTVDLGRVTLYLASVELAEVIDLLSEAQAELSLAVDPPEGE